ncbi:MAG: hypothetical protein L0I24_25580, partial [Pseudonocardia sp.]|nr:hypothetical protein [Pseudonocardia sp.]
PCPEGGWMEERDFPADAPSTRPEHLPGSFMDRRDLRPAGGDVPSSGPARVELDPADVASDDAMLTARAASDAGLDLDWIERDTPAGKLRHMTARAESAEAHGTNGAHRAASDGLPCPEDPDAVVDQADDVATTGEGQ